MAWIESHEQLGHHPKTLKASRALSVSVPQLIGHLHLLWHWALSHAEDGDLSKFDAEDLAIAAKWDGDPEKLIDALVSCGPGGSAGFLECDGAYGDPEEPQQGALVLHDWWDYAGKLVERRRKDRERKGRSSGTPADTQGDSSGTPQELRRNSNGTPTERRSRVTEPNPTKTNRTEPDPTEPNQEPKTLSAARTRKRYPEEFEDFWQAYPRHPNQSKKKAHEVWKRRVRDGTGPADLIRSAVNYAEWCRQSYADDTSYVKHAENWLRDERDEGYRDGMPPPKRAGPKKSGSSMVRGVEKLRKMREVNGEVRRMGADSGMAGRTIPELPGG